MNLSGGTSAARPQPAHPERARPEQELPEQELPEQELPEQALREGALPEWASKRLAAFERHLAAERGLSTHTVRAYMGVVCALLEVSCLSGTHGLTEPA